MRALKLRSVALIAAAMVVVHSHGLPTTMATSSIAIDAGDPLPYHNRPFPRHDEGETIPTASVDGAGAGSAISPSSVLATDYDATTTETFDFVATTRTTIVDEVGIETDITDFVSTVTRTISEGEITMTTFIDVIISTGAEMATEEFTSTTTQTTAAAAGTSTLLTAFVDPSMSLAQAASPITTKSPTSYAETVTEMFTITDTTMTTYVSESAVKESKPALIALAGEAPALTPPSNPLPPPPNEPSFGFIGVDKSLMASSSSATAPKSETTIGSLTLVVLGDDGTSSTTTTTGSTNMLNKIDQEPFYHATHATTTTTNTTTTASEVEMETVSWSTIGFVTVTTTTTTTSSVEEGTGTLRPSVSASSEEVVLTYTSSSGHGTVTLTPVESGTTTSIVLPVHSSAVVESAAAGAAGCGGRWFDLKTSEGLVGYAALGLAVVWVGVFW